MNDLIRRDDAIDCCFHEDGRFRDIRYAVEDIRRLQPIQQWTPCSEGLPKEGGDYLITTSVDIGAEEPVTDVYKDFFCILSQKWLYRDEDAIAWMSLPEPWKGSEK